LGRQEVGGAAIGALSVDSPIANDVLDKLRSLPNMLAVQMTSLPPLEKVTASDHGALSGRPDRRPTSACFGSGPCRKFPGFDIKKLNPRAMGRSHRAKIGVELLKKVIDESKALLQLPPDYLLGIVPASDTGAFEMAMWSMLGEKPVDVFAFEEFGKGWESDCLNELKIKNLRRFTAEYGKLPDISQANPQHDIVFPWNGTTSGVRMPHANWIKDNRTGLTLCDATSAVFAMEIPWSKLDVITYSWQKALGGEGAHGVIILSPRAVERIKSYTPTWPMPKIFRLKDKKGKFDDGLFQGKVINTPSMLCVEDCLAALDWANRVGGQAGMIKRSQASLKVIEKFVAQNDWIHFLAADPALRSSTSVCLTLDLPPAGVERLTKILAQEQVAYDIGSYRSAPPGLRIWCGSTVEASDVEILTEWIKWAYDKVKSESATP